jgi:7-carboxy-7-deazaguanine synthase
MTVKNPETKQIPVMEIFGPTVQGEGSVIGQQTYFIRFGACDYRCKMCDSMHAVDPELVSKNAEWLTQDQIFQKFLNFRAPDTTRWVTFSGGNPCIHDLYLLTTCLKGLGIRIAVETQGTIYQSWLQQCDVVTVSPKSPGMGEQFEESVFTNFITAFSRFRAGLTIKIVVFDDTDLEFAGNVFALCRINGFNDDQFYLSQGNPYPPGGELSKDWKTPTLMTILRARYLVMLEKIIRHPKLCNVKFLPQFHVWLWGNKQGV